jgi:two-component system phosphate regulon sensor histidine kinase PhoR
MHIFRSLLPRPQNTAVSLPCTTDLETGLWKALLETTEDAIILAEKSGRVLQSNQIARRLFVNGAENALSPDTFLSHTLSTELENVFQDCVAGQTPTEAEVSLPPPSARSLHARIVPVAENKYLLVLRDLTELRRLERVRRDFVANVSHELRTPLTSIKAMAETLLEGARLDESVAGRFLETIIHESERLVRLSADLLDLSRVESRGPDKIVIDLAKLVTEVTARFTVPAQKGGVSLSDQVRGPLLIAADRDEMAQVLVNLVDNAISYTPRGGSVRITAAETPKTVTIAVADTGIGILAYDIPRLFERFYRADQARSRASGGTGLGLSIVKHIVEHHGGTVGVESEYNKGSKFTITLPK